MYWQIYKKDHEDSLGHWVGIIPEGFKIPTYSKLLEVFEGTQAEAIKHAENLEKQLQIK